MRWIGVLVLLSGCAEVCVEQRHAAELAMQTDVGRAEQSVQTYLQCPGIDSQRKAWSRTALITIHLFRGDWAEARLVAQQLDKMWSIDEHTSAFAKLAIRIAQIAARDCTPAGSVFNSLLRNGLVNRTIFLRLGTCLLQAQRIDEAEGAASIYIRAHPNDPEGARLMADIQAKTSQPK